MISYSVLAVFRSNQLIYFVPTDGARLKALRFSKRRDVLLNKPNANDRGTVFERKWPTKIP